MTHYFKIGAAGGGPSAPVDASFVVIGLDPDLTDERVLTGGIGITLTDAGAGMNAILNLDTPITVARGGTGVVTLADGGLLVGSDATDVTVLAVGTTGQLLVGATSADPVWTTNVAMVGTLDVQGATLVCSGGIVQAGVDDTTIGTLTAFGASAGGGILNIYNDSDNQATTERWRMQGLAGTEDFIFDAVGGGTNRIFTVDGSTFLMTVPNDLTVGGDIICVDITPSGSILSNAYANTSIIMNNSNVVTFNYLGVEAFKFDDNEITIAIPLVTNADIYNVAWTDYGATSTIVGWSSSTDHVWYKKLGNLVFVKYNITGTSDTTTATFTLPFTSVNSASAESYTGSAVEDNGSFQSSPGRCTLLANAALATVTLDWAGGAFTASGTKTVKGEFWYETA